MGDGVRVDVWLWSVRVYRTRSAANAACAAGRVRVGDRVVKPAQQLTAGDVVSCRVAGRERVLEVVELPRKRLGAALAAEAYADHSPPPEPKASRPAPVAAREPGTGRPTKRDRRRIDRLRGES